MYYFVRYILIWVMDLVSLFELFFIVFFGGDCLICFFFRYRYGNVRGVDFGFFLMFLYCSDFLKFVN